MKILLAVDGSKHSLVAVDCLIEHADWYREKPTVELVTVHAPAAAKTKLGAAGIEYKAIILIGSVAETIVQHAAKTRCDLNFIGTHGRTEASNMLLGSTATKVLHLSKTPVLLVR